MSDIKLHCRQTFLYTQGMYILKRQVSKSVSQLFSEVSITKFVLLSYNEVMAVISYIFART